MKTHFFKNTLYMLKKVYGYIGIKLIFYFIFETLQDVNGILLEIFLVKFVLDKVQYNKSFESILSGILIFGCYFIAFQFLYNIFISTVWKSSETKLKFLMNKSFCEKSKEVDNARFDDSSFYDSYVKAKDVCEWKPNNIIQTVSVFIRMVTRMAIIILFISSINIYLMLVIAIISILSIILNKKASGIYYASYLESVKSNKRISYVGRIFNQYEYAKDLRMYSKMKLIFLNEYTDETGNKTNVIKKHRKALFLIKFTTEYIFNSFILRGMVILVAAYLVLVKHTMSYGFFAVIIPSMMDINDSMSNLANIIPKFSENSYSIENYIQFMNTESRLHNESNGLDVPTSPQRIEINNASFGYNDEMLLNNISLNIEPCEKVAIVGLNGIGKSTLIKLIMRLYDPVEGYIKLGGKNIKEYDLEKYYTYFGTVFQDFKLYSLKLSENVLMNESNQEDTDKVTKALEKLDVSHILKRAINGLDTYISKEFTENGILLSGGESQKIAISRLFANNHPVLIMDEPSSALDPISEFNLNKLLLEQCKDKTIIFISHRLSTTRIADKIVLLGKEGIIEQGSHDQLMNLNGKYADMFTQQASSYRKIEKE